jgi:hypothetical protein
MFKKLGIVILFAAAAGVASAASLDAYAKRTSAVFIKAAGHEDGCAVSAHKTFFEDVTGDGVNDIVIGYGVEGCGGGNHNESKVAILALRNGKYVTVYDNIQSLAGNVVAVHNGQIIIDTVEYGPNDARCCPSIKKTIAYQYNESRGALYKVVSPQSNASASPASQSQGKPVLGNVELLKIFAAAKGDEKKIIAAMNNKDISVMVTFENRPQEPEPAIYLKEGLFFYCDKRLSGPTKKNGKLSGRFDKYGSTEGDGDPTITLKECTFH